MPSREFSYDLKFAIIDGVIDPIIEGSIGAVIGAIMRLSRGGLELRGLDKAKFRP